jgi:hypothetical protein
MRIPPLEVLLSWPTPNYDNPPTRGRASLIFNIIFITLVLIAVILRLYCRIRVRQWFGMDDVMIAPALVSNTHI